MTTRLLPVLFLCGLTAQEPQPAARSVAPPVAVPPKVAEYVPPKDGVLEPAPVMPASLAPVQRPVVNRTAADAGLQALDRALEAAGVMFDQPEPDGALWVKGRNYKASFATDGWTFIGQPRAGAERLHPLAFHLSSARVGGHPIAIADAAPSRKDHRITYQHGGLVQTIDVSEGGVEQAFLLSELPARGELVVDIAVDTGLVAARDGDGIVFAGSHDTVTYSAAVAIDALGERVAAPIEVANGRLTIRVPAAFVQRAKLPLVIDPRVAAGTAYTDASHDVGDPDVAFANPSISGFWPGGWGVVLARYFGGGDWDCYIQFLDVNLQPAMAVLTIDFTSAAWQRPRVASMGAGANSFLTVAEVRSGSNPVKVGGRLLLRALTSGWGWRIDPQIDIATGPVDKIHPDVGASVGTFFVVVWESAYSATDHDIWFRPLNSSANLFAETPIQTNTQFQSWPSVSKSGGDSHRRWAIVYQETFSASDQDIFGALLDQFTQPILVNSSYTFAVDRSTHNDVFPQVSSPTKYHGLSNETQYFLAVYERTTLNNADICATCFDQTGSIRARADINVLENSPTRLAWPQHRPSVDCDGNRFVVGYHELFQNNTTNNDTDTRVSLVAFGANGLFVEEAGVYLGFSTNREFNIQVASTFGATDVPSPRFCTTYDRDNTNNTFAIDAYTYDALPAASFSRRALGCGALSIASSGSTMLGGTVSFSLGAGPTLAGYILGFPTTVPIAGCAGCTIGSNGTTSIGSTLAWNVPTDPSWIGLVIATQGFGFASTGPCFGQISLSDTIDFVVQ